MNYQVLSTKVEALEPNDEGFIAIQVREQRLPLDENGVPNGSSYYHRTVHMPDHDASNDLPTVQAICTAVHTQEWKDKYQAKLDAEAALLEAERLEAERIAAEQEAQRIADAEAAKLAEQEAFEAAVAKAVAAQQGA